MIKCFDCDNAANKDGYCHNHWGFMFEGMTNHERMKAKKDLRAARKSQRG